MGNLQDVHLPDLDLCLGEGLDVPGEGNPGAAQVDDQHDRLVVRRVVAAQRTRHRHRHIGPRQLRSHLGSSNPHAHPGRLFCQRPGCPGFVGLESLPDLAHRMPGEHRHQPVQMIGMDVGRDHDVDAVHPVTAESLLQQRGIGAAVDQHHQVGRHDEGGVALADVEEDRRRRIERPAPRDDRQDQGSGRGQRERRPPPGARQGARQE